jgi:hypothetical protein
MLNSQPSYFSAYGASPTMITSMPACMKYRENRAEPSIQSHPNSAGPELQPFFDLDFDNETVKFPAVPLEF